MTLFSSQEINKFEKICKSFYKKEVLPFLKETIRECKKREVSLLLFLDRGARPLSYSLSALLKKENYFPQIEFFCASKRILGKDLMCWKNWTSVNNLSFVNKKVAIIDSVVETEGTFNLVEKLITNTGGILKLKASFCCLTQSKSILYRFANLDALTKELKFERSKYRVNIFGTVPLNEVEYFYLLGVGSCISKTFPVNFKAGKIINIYSLFRIKKEIEKIPFSDCPKKWDDSLGKCLLERVFGCFGDIAAKELIALGDCFVPENFYKIEVFHLYNEFYPFLKNLKSFLNEVYQQ